MSRKKINIILGFIIITGCGLLKSADDLYKEAEIKRNMGEYKGALSILEKIVKKHVDHKKAPDAQYLIAEIYYRDLGDFSRAIDEYQLTRTKFPKNEQVPFSLFMQGFIYANALSNFEQAKKHYEEFLEKYNNHELAGSVEFELKYLGKDIQEIPELKHLSK